jgi:hypothetical protein
LGVERMNEEIIKKLKVGQEFVECYPNHMWFNDFAMVDITYDEYKITKINEQSIRVKSKNEKGEWLREKNCKNLDRHLFWNKNKTIKMIMKNTPIILKQYDNTIKKYTKYAFQYYYLKAQKRMAELVYELAQNNKLSYEGVKGVKNIIKKENIFLEKKLKEMRE